MSAQNPQRVLLEWVIPTVPNVTHSTFFDATTDEQHSDNADITEHQVETGFNATDHIRPTPKRLTLTGVVTNTPISIPAGQQEIGGSVQKQTASANGQNFDYLALQFDSEFDRVKVVHDELADAIGTGALFTVTTTLAKYENMACENESIPRSAALGNTLQVTLSFKQLRIVSTSSVETPPSEEKTPKKNGKKAGKKVTKPKKLQSLAKSAGKALFQ